MDGALKDLLRGGKVTARCAAVLCGISLRKYRDADQKRLSFRSWHDLLLLGGGSHRTGKEGGGWRELEAFARRHYPAAQVEARWATQDCISLDGVPYIGQYSNDAQTAAGKTVLSGR